MVGDGLTPADMAERDRLVVDRMREPGIPVALVLASGSSAASWKIHADAIEGILTRFDRGLLTTSHSAPMMMPVARTPIP